MVSGVNSEWLDLRSIRDEDHGRPLFSARDAELAFGQMQTLRYGQPAEIQPGLELTLRDAGHILGSAIVELTLPDTRRVVFSGDLGPPGKPLVRDPETVAPADLVVLESTYGNRDHRRRQATADRFYGLGGGSAFKQAVASDEVSATAVLTLLQLSQLGSSAVGLDPAMQCRGGLAHGSSMAVRSTSLSTVTPRLSALVSLLPAASPATR